jgi:hypothetical protein
VVYVNGNLLVAGNPLHCISVRFSMGMCLEYPQSVTLTG